LSLPSTPSARALEIQVLLAASPDTPTKALLERFKSDPELAGIGAVVEEVVVGPFPRNLAEVLAGPKLRLALVSLDDLIRSGTVRDSALTSALGQPGSFSDTRDLFALQDAPLGEAVMAEIARDRKVVAVTYWSRGQSAIVSHSPIRTAADFKGKRLLAWASPTAGPAVLALGAQPVTIAAADVFTAFDRGILDAVEVLPTIAQGFFQPGGQANSLSTRYRPILGFLVAASMRWVDLSERQKAALAQAARSADAAGRTEALAVEARLEDSVRARGVPVINIASTDPAGFLGVGEKLFQSRFGEGSTPAMVQSNRLAVAHARTTPAPARAMSPAASAQTPVLFVTTRNDEGGSDPRYRFGSRFDQTPQLTCGEATYATLGTREAGTSYAGPISLSPAALPTGSDSCVQFVVRRMSETGRSRVLLFIHGFRNTFDDAIRRAIATAGDTGFDGIVLVWSWPADGQVLNYMRDEDAARLTEYQVPKFVRALLAHPAILRFDLLAHSMGTRIALAFLYALQEGAGSERVEHVILAAPDETRDIVRFVLTAVASRLGRFRTLYAAHYDWPLRISSFLHGNDRAGLSGRDIFLLNGLDTIDATDVEAAFWGFFALSHAHVFDVPKAVADLKRLLLEDKAADQRGLARQQVDQSSFWSIPR
jgi:esterase/lipase superfamily enzyme